MQNYIKYYGTISLIVVVLLYFPIESRAHHFTDLFCKGGGIMTAYIMPAKSSAPSRLGTIHINFKKASMGTNTGYQPNDGECALTTGKFLPGDPDNIFLYFRGYPVTIHIGAQSGNPAARIPPNDVDTNLSVPAIAYIDPDIDTDLANLIQAIQNGLTFRLLAESGTDQHKIARENGYWRANRIVF